MKKNNTPVQKLSNVEGKERFVVGHATAYWHNGRTIDLRSVDTATAEALANDPKCGFLQWADGNKRPKGQVRPMELKAANKAEKAAEKPAAK